jgi:Txe/YoeB family toxin of Txe-Axe toxin-antitoxin module
VLKSRARFTATPTGTILVHFATRKTLKRVNALIADVLRTPFEGIAKPEALRENLSG